MYSRFNLAAFPLHGCEWAHLMHFEENQEEKLNEKDFSGCPHGHGADPRGLWTRSGTERGNRPTRTSRAARRAGLAKACPALKGNRVPKGHKGRRVRPARKAIPDRLAFPLGRFRPTARSAAMQMKPWCRCSVRLAVHPMAPSAAAVRPSVFVSKSRSRPAMLRSDV